MASAAPPANDAFADAEDLGAGFPVDTLTWSNVDATKEADEPFEVFTVGHSVWFKWEATTDDVVTVDTCDSEFATSLMVFMGPELDTLTQVGYDSNSDGRFCPDAAGVTFRPVPGMIYSIMVDGNGFDLPGGPVPVTQGSFELKVAKTPPPPNDDFANPIVLSGTSSGEGFYSAFAGGFNWNATKEAGEPDHAGDPGGASVWYQWTAPASGHAEVGACGSFDTLLGIYTGGSVNALAPVAVDSSPVPCLVNLTTNAGMTYRIAVDGRFDVGIGLPKMGGAGVHVAMRLLPSASRIGSAMAPPLDGTPPDTTIHRQVLKRRPGVFAFSFSSTEQGSTFQCKLDKRRFTNCRSSQTFKHLRPGKHTLRARAVDLSGNVDKSPAVARFVIPGPSPHKGRLGLRRV